MSIRKEIITYFSYVIIAFLKITNYDPFYRIFYIVGYLDLNLKLRSALIKKTIIFKYQGQVNLKHMKNELYIQN